jgi:hypothetical protein
MKDKRHVLFERELKKVENQLKVVTGIKTRHKLLKKHRELKKELKNVKKYKKS